MTQKTAIENELGVFPSDKFLQLLTDIYVSNRKNMKRWSPLHHLNNLRPKVEEAILSAIRSAIHSAECASPARLTNFPLSDDESDTFTRWFAIHLVKALTPITGMIVGGKEDGVLAFLYQELSPVGIRQEITDGNYAFVYANGQYMVRLHTPHCSTEKSNF